MFYQNFAKDVTDVSIKLALGYKCSYLLSFAYNKWKMTCFICILGTVIELCGLIMSAVYGSHISINEITNGVTAQILR